MKYWDKVDMRELFDGNTIDQAILELQKLKEKYKDKQVRFNVELGETFSSAEDAYILLLTDEKK
jgi:preprotein translocase subunit Sec63